MTGTLFAPTEQRKPGGHGFTHMVGDLVSIRSPKLGTLTNRVNHCDKIAPWTFGVSALMRNLASAGPAEVSDLTRLPGLGPARADRGQEGLAGRTDRRRAGARREAAAGAELLHHHRRRPGARGGEAGRGRRHAGQAARPAARHSLRRQGPGEHRRRAHDLRLAAPRGQRAQGGRRRGRPHEAGRRDPVRQDHDAGVRPQGADRRAAVRPHAQRLERRAHVGRLERRRGGRGRGRHRADRHRHRRRRLDAHSRRRPTAWSG